MFPIVVTCENDVVDIEVLVYKKLFDTILRLAYSVVMLEASPQFYI